MNHGIATRTSIRALALTFLTLAATAAAQVPTTQETGRDPFAGLDSSLSFQADLFTGRFGYTIPIEAPPARHTPPKIALGYGSNGSDGVCGYGWTLAAGGYIQRETRKGSPIAWSGTQPLNQYDDAKGFTVSFNGISAPLVQLGGIYRAEGDSTWLKFAYDGLSWTVTDRSGNKFFFGESSATRLTHPDPLFPANTGTSVFQWALTRSRDTNGNETYYEYLPTGTNGNRFYLSAVSYNANVNPGIPNLSATSRVSFVYEPRLRSDPVGNGLVERRFSYTSGFRSTTELRLKEIQTYVSDALVRKYVLSYGTSPSTLRSLLNTCTEVAPNGTALPALSFAYQFDTRTFAPGTWGGPLLNTGNKTNSDWNSVRGTFGSDPDVAVHMDLRDFDGDGFPDRVMRKVAAPFDAYAIQYNNGSGFNNALNLENIFQITTDPLTDDYWQSLQYTRLNSGTYHSRVMFLNLDEDPYPDRLFIPGTAPFDNWSYQRGVGNGLLPKQSVFGIDGQGAGTSEPAWNSPVSESTDHEFRHASMADINGDGRMDRVMRRRNAPFDRFVVQLQEAGPVVAFGAPVDWLGVLTPGQSLNAANWHCVENLSNDTDVALTFKDINGDGLPDRVMREPSPSLYGDPAHPTWYDRFVVQFNTGYRFEPAEEWGPIMSQGQNTSPAWNSISAADTADTHLDMLDINGDGLLDRVMRKLTEPYTYFVVQLNNGSGFDPDVYTYPITSQGVSDFANRFWCSVRASDGDAEVYVDMADINGDGLVDRVMRKRNSPYTDSLAVELSQGPFPDLLKTVSNGIGGSVGVTYRPSTQYDNRDREVTSNPWQESAVGLLAFPVQTVATVTVNDGLGTQGTTTYAYKNGYYDSMRREFRGFRRVEATDPVGVRTVTWFQQGGGYFDDQDGETADDPTKAGAPFRKQVFGSDGHLYNETFNEISVATLGTWHFPFLEQTVSLVYESGASAKMTAVASTYDTTTTGNLLEQIEYGEVSGFSPFTHSFSDIGTDKRSTTYVYQSFAAGNADIVDHPQSITKRSSAGVKLAEHKFTYDLQRGNPLTVSEWLDTDNSYVTYQFGYGGYGNQTSQTDPTNALTTTVFDTTYRTFPISTTAQNFVTQMETDPATGLLNWEKSLTGLKTEYHYDALHRLTEILISSVKDGPADLWRKRYSYTLAPPTGFFANSCVVTHTNDATDEDGYVSLQYFDGLGRPVQSRAEAEVGYGNCVPGQVGYRVTVTDYDVAGRAAFQSVPLPGCGQGFTLVGNVDGTVTTYDPISRPASVTPPGAPGDIGAPVAPSSVQYGESGNPWARVETDALGFVKRQHMDAFGRVIELIEERGTEADLTTGFQYDTLGNLLKVVHPGGIETTQTYDSLDRRTSSTDPDMGHWTYEYDAMGRLKASVDALLQRSEYSYDSHGRVTQKKTYNAAHVWVYEELYDYDSSDDATYAVLPGQMYRVTEHVIGEATSNYQKNSYDFRGRLLKTTRFLTLTNLPYTTSYSYDGADRVKTMSYPAQFAVEYAYDSAGHVQSVTSLSGMNTPTTFYHSEAFDDLGRVAQSTLGNGVVCTNDFYPESRRLKTVRAMMGTTKLQELTYGYDAAYSVASVTDGAYSGTGSGGLTNVQYDGLHRLKSLTRAGTSTPTNYTYDDLGNVLTNAEFGTGTYAYAPSHPHAVTSANGMSYTYDANGNMTARGPTGATVPMVYNERNQLVQYGTGSTAVTFRYDHDGHRLWRKKQLNKALWIGSHYEVNFLDTLCHVLVDGVRVCSVKLGNNHLFPPLPAVPLYVHQDHLHSTSVVSNASGGLSEHYEYTAFGNERFETYPGPYDLESRFTGQILDDATGLYWIGSRYYDPVSGRFTQPDSIVPDLHGSQSLNRYSYCGNNPLSCIDPSGHFFFAPFIVQIAISATVSGVAAELQGGEFWDGFVSGAVTGAFTAGFSALGAGEFASGLLGSTASTAVQHGSWQGAFVGGLASAGLDAALPSGVSPGFVKHTYSPGWFAATGLDAFRDSLVGGIGGGLGSVVGGGEFDRGFSSGATGAAAASLGKSLLIGPRINTDRLHNMQAVEAQFGSLLKAGGGYPDRLSFPEKFGLRAGGMVQTLFPRWHAFGTTVAIDPSKMDVGVLSHELTHVAQFQYMGAAAFVTEYLSVIDDQIGLSLWGPSGTLYAGDSTYGFRLEWWQKTDTTSVW